MLDKDFNEITKQMAKEEFLNSPYIKDYCPSCFNIKTNECANSSNQEIEDCKRCWETATSDISFKDDVLKGWQITKMISEGTLKDGDSYIRLRVNDGIRKIKEMEFTIGSSSMPDYYSFINDEFKLKEKEYMTFDEARMKTLENESLSCFKHRDMPDFKPTIAVFAWLIKEKSDKEINKMLSEKLWEVK